ncbi:MAG TPA: hypothetical protein VK009_23975 [Chloroflexota bacterium]|nr:hypothetical protein [Chloroflexota bacterium]
MVDKRIEAAEAYVQALRLGEASGAERAARFLAPDIVLVDGKQEYTGAEQVLRRITGWWPFTGRYRKGAWSDPAAEGEQVVVTAELPPPGAGPAKLEIRFSFDGQDRISRTEYRATPGALETTDRIPDFVKSLLDTARMNNSPTTVAYTAEDGAPVLSFRGSTQVLSPTQLSIWMRNPEGAMVRALATNPRMAISYFDPSNTWLLIEGRGHITADAALRRYVFDRLVEVERNHDPDCHGAALIIDVDRLEASTAWGRVRMVREG